MSILISFLNLLLYLAIIIFVAYCIVWLIRGFMGWPIDARWARQGQRQAPRQQAAQWSKRDRLSDLYRCSPCDMIMWHGVVSQKLVTGVNSLDPN
jgi:hypothetical protein